MIENQLEKYLAQSDSNKSSYWKNSLNDKDYSNIYSHLGFGNFTKKNFFKSILHYFLQKKVFGSDFFRFKEYKIYKEILQLQNRQIDIDVVRHIFTFNLLKKYNFEKKKICIVGDGKANFITGCLKIFPGSKIISINLPEVLIHDYLIIKKFNLISDEKIKVVNVEKDLIDESKSLFLVPASKASLVESQRINLFVNICSFQEMEIKEIKKYFDIIKSNRAFFYCCNREYKQLPGGENIYFKDYPWGGGKKIFIEDCTWCQNLYSFRPPFVYKYDGNIKHALIDYS